MLLGQSADGFEHVEEEAINGIPLVRRGENLQRARTVVAAVDSGRVQLDVGARSAVGTLKYDLRMRVVHCLQRLARIEAADFPAAPRLPFRPW